MITPAPLVDSVPGNIGLIPGARAVLALRFDEVAGVLVSDELGNLDDLAHENTFTVEPSVVGMWAGPGRSFVAGTKNGLIASDLAGKLTLLQRDVTIQALIALDLSGGAQPTSTIIARGTHDGTAAGAFSYGLELFAPGGAGVVGVRWFWEDSGGVIRTDGGASFQSPGDGAEFVLTATRRWESSSSVVMRYYVNDQLLAETTSTHGDISGGTTGATTIGGRKNLLTGSPVSNYWEHFLTAQVDELVVSAFEMSPQEVAQVYARLAVHQPAGVEMFAGLTPTGSTWYADRGNRIGRFVKVAGQALGLGIASAEELRALWLPDAAPLETIGRWEALCGLSPGAVDSLDVRRQRIVSYLSRDEGYSVPDVETAMAAVLDCQPSDLQILEFTNQITDDFSTFDVQRWMTGDIGVWTAPGGVLQLHQASGFGAGDLRWEPTRAHCVCHTSLFLSDSARIENTNFFLACKVAAYTIPHNTMAGLQLFDAVSNQWFLFGVYVDGAGVAHIGWCSNVGGVLGAFTPLAAAPAAPVWLRLQQTPPSGFAGAGTQTFKMSWSTVGATPTSSFATASVNKVFSSAAYAGFAAVGTDAAIASDLTVQFDDFVMHCPNGDRPFWWYVYRNPALGGAPDLVGARLLAKKIKPAHTYGGVIDGKSVVLDDAAEGLCDCNPLGAL